MNVNMHGSSNKCAGKESYTYKKLESSKRKINIKNVAIGRLTSSWKNMQQQEDKRDLGTFCFDDSCMHAQTNEGKLTAILLDLQEIPFHRIGHYHNYFIACFISIITDSEEYVNQSTFEICRRESLYCIQNTRTVIKPVGNVVQSFCKKSGHY